MSVAAGSEAGANMESGQMNQWIRAGEGYTRYTSHP